MKNYRKIPAAAALLLTFCIALGLLSGCAWNSETDSGTSVNKKQSINILLSIEYPQKSRLPIMENIKFPLEENSTVLQAIELYCSVAEIPCILDTTSNQIVGINTVHNGDFNKHKVWKFSVGGKEPQMNAADVRLKDGDELRWVYVKDPAAAGTEDAE